MALIAVEAKNVKASDLIDFHGTVYKAKQVLTYHDRVEIVFHNTNDGQPYTYEPGEILYRARAL